MKWRSNISISPDCNRVSDSRRAYVMGSLKHPHPGSLAIAIFVYAPFMSFSGYNAILHSGRYYQSNEAEGKMLLQQYFYNTWILIKSNNHKHLQNVRDSKSFPTTTITRIISCILGVWKNLTKTRVVHPEIFSFEIGHVSHWLNKPISPSMEAWWIEKKKGVNACRTILELCGSGGEQCKLSSGGVTCHLQISWAIPLFFNPSKHKWAHTIQWRKSQSLYHRHPINSGVCNPGSREVQHFFVSSFLRQNFNTGCWSWINMWYNKCTKHHGDVG